MTKITQNLQDLAEFSWIHQLSNLSGSNYGSDSSVPGDDAAVLSINESSLLMAKDMLIEGTHFRTDWSSAKEWVRKAFVANVSDIEAMGGFGHSVLCGISFSEDWSVEYKSEIAIAISLCLKEFNLKLVGGDTTCSKIGVISLTLLGSHGKKIVARNSLKPGHELWVQGDLGASYLGLSFLLNSTCKTLDSNSRALVQEHVNPKIKFGLGSYLSNLNVPCGGMDMSDGLGQSLFHLSEASKVSLTIEENLIPISKLVLNSTQNFDRMTLTEIALWGGEEFKMIFSLPYGTDLSDQIISKWNLSKIGYVEKGQGCYIKLVNNEKSALKLKGFSHF
jgi:thiamine-monophosphate kinase